MPTTNHYEHESLSDTGDKLLVGNVGKRCTPTHPPTRMCPSTTYSPTAPIMQANEAKDGQASTFLRRLQTVRPQLTHPHLPFFLILTHCTCLQIKEGETGSVYICYSGMCPPFPAMHLPHVFNSTASARLTYMYTFSPANPRPSQPRPPNFILTVTFFC